MSQFTRFSRVNLKFWKLCWCKTFDKYHVWTAGNISIHNFTLVNQQPHKEMVKKASLPSVLYLYTHIITKSYDYIV